MNMLSASPTEQTSPEPNSTAGIEVARVFASTGRREMPVYLGLVGLTLLARWLTMPGYVESRDGLFFVRAVQRYSVFEVRPQWPGYPVYIWLGSLLNLLTNNPVLALHLVSLVTSSLCVWPVAAVAAHWRREQGGNANQALLSGMCAGLLFALLPLSWLGGGEIFSDSLGLLLGACILWAGCLALQQPERAGGWLGLAAILGGLMMGVRLSYVTLILPLLWVGWHYRRQPLRQGAGRRVPVLLAMGAAFGLAVASWLGWQFVMEGTRFIEAGVRHLRGHYTSWGGSITTDQNLLSRPVRLVETLVVYGLGGWWPGLSWWRIPATLGLMGLFAAGARVMVKAPRRPALWLAVLWGGPYLLWIGLGNDIDLARYFLPVVTLVCIVAGVGLPSRPRLALATLLGVAGAVAVISVPQAIQHRDSLPIGQQLTNFVTTRLDPARSLILISTDNSPLLFFLVDNARTYTAIPVNEELLPGQVKIGLEQGRTVFATFLPGNAPAGWQPEARLCRGRFMESRGPLEMWIYRYAPQPGRVAPPPDNCYQAS